MDKKESYTLIDISQWKENEDVSLPTVQRGFVWKPFQIENLWDSLLRGYPVGAFVLAPEEDNNKVTYKLLDGQQRATAICIGFQTKTFKGSHENLRLFIDLVKPKPDDNRQYLFRVISRSHPWGYQRKDNSKPLDSENIRKALDLFDVDDYLNEPISNFYPFEADIPIPFEFFLHAAINHEEDRNELKKNIENWKHWNKIIKDWLEKVDKLKSENKELPELQSVHDIWNRINSIYHDVLSMLKPEIGQRIPTLFLDFDKILLRNQKENIVLNESNNGNEEPETPDDIANTKTDQIENLFIRLNSGGTPLRGEELNYSILKSHIKPKSLIDDIENSCHRLFNPARFITIMFRLYQCSKGQESRESVIMRIKPKVFQKSIIDDKIGFINFINKTITDKKYENMTLLEYTRYLLEYNNTPDDIRLPYVVVSKLSDQAPEIVFMLMYRLLLFENGDRFIIGDELHKKMLGMTTMFVWLGKSGRSRDHRNLMSNIWPCVKNLKREQFWSSSTVQRAMLNDVLTPIPEFNKLNKLIKYIDSARADSSLWDKFENDTEKSEFIAKLFYEKDLVYYSQRAFLGDWFSEIQFHLDDTNRPFDLDHISPYKYYSKRGQKNLKIMEDWYGSNGNFRAWPYSLNRIDQDTVPAVKLDPINRLKYPKKYSEEEFNLIKVRWANFLKKTKKIDVDKIKLSELLLGWSACEKEWINCAETDLTKTPNCKYVLKLIIKRNIELCKEWYKLGINDLIPVNDQADFKQLLKQQGQWEPIKYNSKQKFFNYDDTEGWKIKKPLKVGSSEIYTYLEYTQKDKNNKTQELKEGNVWLGLIDFDSDEIISKIVVTEKIKSNFIREKNSIYGRFTLISYDEDSYKLLLSEFITWLENIKIKGIDKQELVNHIKDGVYVKFLE